MIVSRKEAEKKLGKELRGPQYVGKRWFLLSRSVPHRNLGGFATKQEAKDHERAVQYFKRNPTPVPEGVRDKNLWLRYREKVKKRVSVWPSAYASGQVVQEYKRAGGRFYNPGNPLDEEALLELELAVLENPKQRKDDWDISDRRGTVGLTFNWFDWAPEYPLLRDLEAKEKRKGYGSSLVKAAISEARKRGAKGIILPPPESAESRKFWKSQDGWKPLRKKGYRGWMVYRFTEKNPLTGLDKWFAEEWVDMARSVYLSGPKAGHLKPGGWVKCGRPDTTKGGYPKCRPLAEAKKMTPKQRIYAIRKKRKAERDAPSKKGRAPIMVKTYKKKNPEDNPRSKHDANASKVAKGMFLLFKKNEIFKARSSTIDEFEEFDNPAEHYADDAGVIIIGGKRVSLHIGLRIDRKLRGLIFSGGYEPESGKLTVFAARPYRLKKDADMDAAYSKIYEIVRHEMEHAMQDAGPSAGEMPGKSIRSSRDFIEYYLDPHEIEAHAVGLYAKSKKRGIPFSITLSEFKSGLESKYPRVSRQHINKVVREIEAYAMSRYPSLGKPRRIPKRGVKELRKMIEPNPSSVKKEIKKILKQAEQQGCRIIDSGKHYKIRCPDSTQFTVSKTPSDKRAIKNIKSDFRRAGVEINPQENPERKKLYIYPNKSAVKIAKRALERRKKLPKSKRGGLDAMDAHEQGIGSGVLRARDIAAGKRINAYQVKAFFDRHRHNFVKAKADGKKWEDSKAWQAWDLWGGEPLRKQVEKAVEKDKKMRKSNPPKTMPSASVIRFLSFDSADLYKNVGYTDAVGQHTPIPDDMLEDFERADKMLQRASRIDPMYDDRYLLIKKADAILRPMRDKVFEIHRDRFYKKRPSPRDRKMPNPYRKERFEHEGVPAGLKESKYESWGDWEARQGMYTGPIPPDPIAERKRRAEIKAKAKAKLERLRGNPEKPPLAKDLIAECRALWESYCERPGKMRLRKVEKHCNVMKASKYKTVKDERRRCMNAVRREKKKLWM